ncbi:hypothetical protein LCGC14_1390910 [marine sediment metagenome]|uniref:Uncharacterized protein n=1 Tax=marine sediment metagenome TaxID=412755 RepID=A0A0F9K073_9ZZZZ
MTKKEAKQSRWVYCLTCMLYKVCAYKNCGTIYCPQKTSTIHKGRKAGTIQIKLLIQLVAITLYALSCFLYVTAGTPYYYYVRSKIMFMILTKGQKKTIEAKHTDLVIGTCPADTGLKLSDTGKSRTIGSGKDVIGGINNPHNEEDNVATGNIMLRIDKPQDEAAIAQREDYKRKQNRS